MKFYLILIIFALGVLKASAQREDGGASCIQGKRAMLKRQLQGKPTLGDPQEDRYDIKYVHLDIAVDTGLTGIVGVVTTRALTTALLDTYVFELSEDYTIDSVKINGETRPANHMGDIRKVALKNALPAGDLFTARVYYHGISTAGIFMEIMEPVKEKGFYTYSEPFYAKYWWPCKQSLRDKIDSSDVWITVPSAFKTGSNGVLKVVTPIAGGMSRYEWKNSNAIAYYLISLAAAPYIKYDYYTHFTGSTDSVLVQNYIFGDELARPEVKQALDQTGMMINFFSNLFGRYPFWKEKYGHCSAPLMGFSAMEHQTMTTTGSFVPWVLAHELGHQWFGDHVTCGSWADIWLNEGFASYCEYLFENYSEGAVVAGVRMEVAHNYVFLESGGSVYCIDSTNADRILNYRLSYQKGSAVVHMLRFMAANDNQFFNMLKAYQVQFANGTATTEQFKAFAAAAYGQSLDVFFNQWIYGEGYPTYTAKWNQTGDQVVVQLGQTTSMPTSVSLFVMPMELKLSSAAGDTVVKVFNNAAIQTFSFTWAKTMTGMAIDPNNWIINKTGSITKDNTLLSLIDHQAFTGTVYPNPTQRQWTLSGLSAGSSLSLCDMSGRILKHIPNSNKQTVDIDASALAPGIYLLHITRKDAQTQYLKLLKSE